MLTIRAHERTLDRRAAVPLTDPNQNMYAHLRDIAQDDAKNLKHADVRVRLAELSNVLQADDAVDQINQRIQANTNIHRTRKPEQIASVSEAHAHRPADLCDEFDQIDVNGDGLIDRAEWNQHMHESPAAEYLDTDEDVEASSPVRPATPRSLSTALPTVLLHSSTAHSATISVAHRN